MRIFVGIKPSDNLLSEMDKFLKPFIKIGTPLKWTQKENIHVTLKFIGEVSPKVHGKIDEQITQNPFDTGPLNLEIAGCGKFGKRDDLSIFWLGIEPNPGLRQVFEQLQDLLEPVGIEKDTRPFTPHITVARNKRQYNFKSFFQLMETVKDKPIAQLPVSHVQLYQSVLTPRGPVYTILKEIPLDAS